MKKNKLFRNLLIIAFIAWIAVLIKQQLNISQYKDDIKVLSSKIEVAEDELDENKKKLEEEKQNTNSPKYIEDDKQQ